MDAVSYSNSAKQAKRIKRFIENPDSNSGVLTQPKVIEAGETVTIKSGRQAILADMVVKGDLVIEAGADVSMLASVVPKSLEDIIDTLDSSIVKLTGNQTIEGIKTFVSSPIVPTPTTDFQVATKKYVDDVIGGGAGTGGGGGLSIEDKAKLDSIEEEATKNETDAFLLSRSNHTGSIPISVVENLEQELANISTGGSGGLTPDELLRIEELESGIVKKADLDSEGKILTSQLPVIPTSLPDADSDGKLYGRKDGTWTEIVNTGGEVNLTYYYTKSETDLLVATKQDTLVSGTSIKTINGQSILGDGNIEITGGGSGGGYFTGTAGITVGGITTGDTFKDVPVTDMINNLINPELTPNLTNPNNVLTSTVSGLREIGTSITPRLTATFNRGSISPQYSASEPYRAGLPTKYVFTSTAGLNQEVETDATTYGIDVSSFEVALGTVTFSSNISYSAGPQPTTSKGNVFNNPLPAGTTGNKTVTITGVYPCYNGISTLTKMTLANHGGTITVDAPADMNVGGERFKIQYPTVWSAKTPVVQQENELSKAWDNQNISDYSITTIDKNGVSYKQVEYVGAGIGARKLRLVF